MKLRHDKGSPLIVLEAGDMACLKRAAALLAGASVHVGEFPEGTLQDLSEGLRKVLRGEVAGVTLPKKRQPKEQPPTMFPAEPAPEPAKKNGRQKREEVVTP